MSTDLIVGIANEAIKVTLLLSAPMLIVGLVVGLIISIFQAVTQVQEMTLTFVPKIIAVMLALIIALTFLRQKHSEFQGIYTTSRVKRCVSIAFIPSVRNAFPIFWLRSS